MKNTALPIRQSRAKVPCGDVVEIMGFEPMACTLRTYRSTN